MKQAKKWRTIRVHESRWQWLKDVSDQDKRAIADVVEEILAAREADIGAPIVVDEHA